MKNLEKPNLEDLEVVVSRESGIWSGIWSVGREFAGRKIPVYYQALSTSCPFLIDVFNSKEDAIIFLLAYVGLKEKKITSN